MKTPREILLAQHRAVESKLDDIRRLSVAAVYDRSIASKNVSEWHSQSAASVIWQTFWHELILPSCRTWAGLAVVWLIIIVVNLANYDNTPAGKVTVAPAMMSLREQQRWMNELFADRSLPMDAEPAKTVSPKPRTAITQFSTV